jgi:hypothetical protein
MSYNWYYSDSKRKIGATSRDQIYEECRSIIFLCFNLAGNFYSHTSYRQFYLCILNPFRASPVVESEMPSVSQTIPRPLEGDSI